MGQRSKSRKLNDGILEFCRHIAGSDRITAACAYGDDALDSLPAKMSVEILLIIRGFQSKLMNYMKAIDGRSVIVIAVDEWIFERDVDRGFLGEALAWCLILPYLPMVNGDYLRLQEVKLKKRIIVEILENLVLDFPELSHELHIKPEYFMYEAMQSRARLFPPMVYGIWGFMRRNDEKRSLHDLIGGYLKALRELEDEGVVYPSNGYVKISEKLVDSARGPRVRLENLSKTVPRALFMSLLGILPRVLSVLSQNGEVLARLHKGLGEKAVIDRIGVPEDYVYVPTASGLVPLANRTDVEAFARRILCADKDAKVTVEALGGILNDVYVVKTLSKGVERKAVVKKFRDWSSFKWFPLSLWSIGTRTFAVLGRPRLERECAINQFLHSKGIAVPRLLHVSPDQRLVFMEYVDGENVSTVIKKLAASSNADATAESKIITRVGKQFAKVHALGIALGDTKPENIMIGQHKEIFLMDFEQASRNGDKVWDVAEFLYYAGHDLPTLIGTRAVELVAKAFVAGYLEAGGSVETIKKAGNPKYTRVFSIFTLPHIMLAISNICKRAGEF